MTTGGIRAPRVDGGVLAIPKPQHVTELARANRAWLESWSYDVQGRSALAVREHARREVWEISRQYLASHGLEPDSTSLDSLAERTLVMTGHQPELFHPGVWIKNFACWAIARLLGGWSLNMIVDNDIPKASAILAPRRAGDRVRLTRVEFDEWAGEIPYEDWTVADPSRLEVFPERLRAAMEFEPGDWLLDQHWGVVRALAGVPHLGTRFSIARRMIEQDWGVRNHEVPLAALSGSSAFLWFLSHMLAQLPRYRDVHNQALEEYRAEHGIRSKNHPVAALDREGDWIEAPFWAWRQTAPRRRPLLARQRARSIELRIAGEHDTLIELPLAPDMSACCAVERLQALHASEIRIRPRALATTMFCRLFLADLFIHGIGGAKYDELGDRITSRFLGITPPPFLTLSLTLHRNGLPVHGTSEIDIARNHRLLRDLAYSPDRFLDEPTQAAVRNLLDTKRAAITRVAETPAERKARWAEIRQINAALAPYVQDKYAETIAALGLALERSASDRVARSREFSIVLHSTSRLRDVMLGSVRWG